jgi:hypothetical protein
MSTDSWGFLEVLGWFVILVVAFCCLDWTEFKKTK